jgi:hypothetical protein
MLMPQELNWCGLPILPGESYGGRPENISKPWGRKSEQAASKQHQHFAVITESDVGEVFGFGEYELPLAQAAKLLQELTGTHRTTAYRALSLNGRFARHLHTDGTTLSWRSL